MTTHNIHTVYFRDREFYLYEKSSRDPSWLMDSFRLEHALREEWWHISPGDVVVDVGAAYGSYTFTALCQGADLVIAYEPCMSELFDLHTNLMVNGWLPRCWTVPFLAGREKGVLDAFYPDSHSVVPRGWSSPRFVLPIDYLVSTHGVGRLDWIKVDAEGAEVAVLAGAKESITKFRPKLLIECHNAFVPGIEGMIRDFMNTLPDYTELVKRGNAGNDTWVLWTPKEKT